MTSGVSFESMNAAASRPAVPSRSGSTIGLRRDAATF